MKERTPPKSPREAWLIYDGECPFCSAYVRRLHFNENYGPVTLLNARESHPIVSAAAKLYDLDEGMVLRLGDDYYFGADCIHVLSLLSDRRGLFGRVNGVIFRHRTLSRVLYPMLRCGRNLTLRLLGRRKLGLSARLE